MKILVVVSGLVLIVPDAGPNPAGVTVLLAKYAMHKVALRQHTERQSVRNWSVSSGYYDATMKVEAAGALQPQGMDHVIKIGGLVLGATPRSDCLNNNCNQVAGRFRADGPWKIMAKSRCERGWDLPPHFSDTATIDYRQLQNLDVTKPGHTPEPRATAVILEVEKADTYELSVGGMTQTLAPSHGDVCEDWTGKRDPCIVLEVENWPEADIDAKCVDYPTFDECRLDQHFGVLYELFDFPGGKTPDPAERWLPYVYELKPCGDESPNGAGHYPALRCPVGG